MGKEKTIILVIGVLLVLIVVGLTLCFTRRKQQSDASNKKVICTHIISF